MIRRLGHSAQQGRSEGIQSLMLQFPIESLLVSHRRKPHCAHGPAAVRGDRILNAARAKGKALGMNYEKVLERLTKDYALKRLIEPSEVATAAVFLASDDASAITGHTLAVSCGLHISHY